MQEAIILRQPLRKGDGAVSTFAPSSLLSGLLIGQALQVSLPGQREDGEDTVWLWRREIEDNLSQRNSSVKFKLFSYKIKTQLLIGFEKFEYMILHCLMLIYNFLFWPLKFLFFHFEKSSDILKLWILFHIDT